VNAWFKLDPKDRRLACEKAASAWAAIERHYAAPPAAE
jgi:hypothetical protein